MPWNGKKEKIMGTGCNHHEIMVATEKRNPVNIIFYLSKVISLMLLDSCPSPKIPENKKNTYPSIYKDKKSDKKSEHRKTPSSQFLLSFITSVIAPPTFSCQLLFKDNSHLGTPTSPDPAPFVRCDCNPMAVISSCLFVHRITQSLDFATVCGEVEKLAEFRLRPE